MRIVARLCLGFRRYNIEKKCYKMYSTRTFLFCLTSHQDATHLSQYGNILYHNDDDLDLNEFVVSQYAYAEDKSISYVF